MALVSFQVIDGVDKGRMFLSLETPVTIGREEGNMIRLNDERVSRFHAKVQEDQGKVVLTDLDSTNGTCVNGEPIQLRLLRPGDRLNIGRSILLFGTPEEIAAAVRDEAQTGPAAVEPGMATVVGPRVEPTRPGAPAAAAADPAGTDVASSQTGATEIIDVFERTPPKLPTKLSPAQAAQLSEVIDFLHRALAHSTEQVHIPANGNEARLPLGSWHRLQTVLTFLARYSRMVADPDEADGNG